MSSYIPVATWGCHTSVIRRILTALVTIQHHEAWQHKMLPGCLSQEPLHVDARLHTSG